VTGVLCNGVDACLQGLPCEFLSRNLTHLMLGASPALTLARRALKSAGHLVLDGVELRHRSVGARRVRKDNGLFSTDAFLASLTADMSACTTPVVPAEIIPLVTDTLMKASLPSFALPPPTDCAPRHFTAAPPRPKQFDTLAPGPGMHGTLICEITVTSPWVPSFVGHSSRKAAEVWSRASRAAGTRRLSMATVHAAHPI
jgi:hypothetical protein